MRLRAIPWLVALAVLAADAPADAKTYRWINEQGVVTYSDTPPRIRPVEGEREVLIAEALEISGIKKALELIPELIRAQLELLQTALGAQDKTRAGRIVTDAFRPEVLYNAVRDAFRTNYDPPRMGLVMAQLRSPLFRRITALELAASAPGARPEIERYTAELKGNVPSETRLSLVQRHEAALRSAERQVEMMVVAFQAVVRALEPVLAPGKRPTAREAESAERAMRAQQEGLTRAALVVWLFAYRSLSAEDLSVYVEFGESDHGRWFMGTQRKGQLDAMRAALDSAARQMAKAFPPKR